ncbi:hypothetical protein BTO30_14800 [Domibacillus antri]|uniref:Helix-turn-helix domain-containing protein n=1 Tax=Domibacillus antri TaxID=1714264 RepID=A0A1Q8Q296_9BACI|nr:helix-turn-helix domain-containing protein [Domibacillus antri]OLN21469.1 hypothetical protein BTO30_14800 [Domibacillus antri]
MCEHKILSNDEFQTMQQYKPFTVNHAQQQETKLSLLHSVIAAYGEKFYRLKEGTRKSIEMICWFAAEKGYCFAGDEYFAERFNVTDKTIRNIFKKLRDHGLVKTVYRRSTTQNGLGAPIHLFVQHPYFKQWIELLQLNDFQADFQAENDEIPCESREKHLKKVSTKYLSFNKNLLKILRKENRLGITYTPKNVPQIFIKAVKPFFNEAENVYSLWGKVLLAYKKFSLANPITDYTNVAIDAFKQTVFAHKHRKIKKDFKGYFYGTLMNMFTYKKREEAFESHPLIFNWLEKKNDAVLTMKDKGTNWRKDIAELIAKEEQMYAFSEKEIPY